MNALLLLYERKIERLRRLAYMYVGYDSGSTDVSEKLYGVYIVILLGLGGLFMLAWIVVNIGKVLSIFTVPLQPFSQLVFTGMALWLVWLVFRSANTYDLQQFELSDLDFLSQSPLSTGLITLVWWVKSFFKRTIGGFVLVCAIVSSTASYLSKGNDILALVIGGASATLFIIVSGGLRWVLGMWKYIPVRRPHPIFGYAVALALLVLVFTPYAPYIFWPATLTSWLLVGRALDENATLTLLALGGMLLMVLAGVLILWRQGRASRLAPALEEGSLGGRFRLAAKVDKASAGEAALLYHLGRRLQSGRGAFKARQAQADFWRGPVLTILLRQGLRLQRLPVTKLLPGVALAVGTGAIAALGLVVLRQLNASLIVQIQVIFLVNWVLLRAGVGGLRRELSHPDMLVNWPVSRLRFSIYYLVLGFITPLVSGEVVLFLALLTGLDKTILYSWQVLWLVLVVVNFVVTLGFFKRGLAKWSGNPLDVPNAGPFALILCGVAWSIAAVANLSTGLLVAGAFILSGLYYVRNADFD
ncbi:MAG: hypothetical protein J0I20_25115 [Chloroflexi bacterium]|nr:hypothetical protein [Chloroflexota bacterium]OJW02070.1 MAG: hypothetical protein BGO39_27690 [Chloroflexi bacterium 54-19]